MRERSQRSRIIQRAALATTIVFTSACGARSEFSEKNKDPSPKSCNPIRGCITRDVVPADFSTRLPLTSTNVDSEDGHTYTETLSVQTTDSDFRFRVEFSGDVTGTGVPGVPYTLIYPHRLPVQLPDVEFQSDLSQYLLFQVTPYSVVLGKEAAWGKITTDTPLSVDCNEIQLVRVVGATADIDLVDKASGQSLLKQPFVAIQGEVLMLNAGDYKYRIVIGSLSSDESETADQWANVSVIKQSLKFNTDPDNSLLINFYPQPDLRTGIEFSDDLSSLTAISLSIPRSGTTVAFCY